jgi:hypothetical protein
MSIVHQSDCPHVSLYISGKHQRISRSIPWLAKQIFHFITPPPCARLGLTYLQEVAIQRTCNFHICPWCGRQFGPLSPTYLTFSHLYMETNSIMKICEERYLCFTKFWEDPIGASLSSQVGATSGMLSKCGWWDEGVQ